MRLASPKSRNQAADIEISTPQLHINESSNYHYQTTLSTPFTT